MTSYHGGKLKIGNEIAKVISAQVKKQNFDVKGYCEPFCGMLGVYQHIPDHFQNLTSNLLAGDLNNSVILMWQDAQKGWIPPTNVSEEEYNKLKTSTDLAEKGYVGHQYGFGGKYFKGYAPKYGKNINSTSASNRVVNIAKKLKDVVFSHGEYTQFSDLKGFVIYCDPPYNSTESHYASKFNNKDFYDWCITMSKNNLVFVSEYNTPDNFIEIWSKSNKLSGVSKSEGEHKSKVRTEKLYFISALLHPNDYLTVV